MGVAAYHLNMSGQTGRELAPPGGLRPAQLGVVLVGRVLLGHIGATVVDLACRGCLRAEPLDEDGSDWQLNALSAVPEDLLGYEQAIVHGFFGNQAAFRLEHMTFAMTPVLDEVRAGIVRDALDAGRLRAGIWRRFAFTQGQRRRQDQKPGRRTRPGQELLTEIKQFRGDLRALAAVGDMETLARFASYAMIFGLTAPLRAGNLVPEDPHGEAVPPIGTAQFAACWLKAWGSGEGDFIGWVFDPYGGGSNDHGSLDGHHGHVHGGGHDGYGGHHGGGHHGGFGGHHGGYGGDHGVGGGHVGGGGHF
jgi:hypothetical protein